MATLKISGLSVGDWVRCGEDTIPYKIIGIDSKVHPNVTLCDSYYPQGVIALLDMIHPIPITAEILEKNGFVRSTSEFIVYHTDNVWISYDKPSETWSVTMYINNVTSNLHANIKYIHNLQHALRLAGVDKEINL